MNRSELVRPGSPLQLRLAGLLSAVAGIGIALLVFVPPLFAKFTSDTFYLYTRALAQSPNDIAALFVPAANNWFRPVTDLAMWLEARAFGQNPIGYHLVALASQLLCTVLIFKLTARLAGSRKAALLAALVFLANPHAQQPLWDISFLHVVLSTPVFLTGLLAYVSGRRWIAWLLALFALGIDESGLLLIAVIGLYELIVACTGIKWGNLKTSALRIAPLATIAVVYLAARIFTGSIYSEVAAPCRRPLCLADAASEYFTRFMLRPDTLLSGLSTYLPIFVAIGLLVVAGVVLLVRPWGWSEKRVPLFLMAWLALATTFFILTLWPYRADRFLYVPDCALVVLIGVMALRATDGRLQWSPMRKWASYAAAGAFAIWIAAGPWMMFNRGQLNIDAGNKAAAILHQFHVLVPNPPSGAVFVVRDVPYNPSPQIPPGNDGPYLFNNGLQEGIQLEYGRSDLFVVVGRDASTPAQAGAYLFDIRDGSVVLIP